MVDSIDIENPHIIGIVEHIILFNLYTLENLPRYVTEESIDHLIKQNHISLKTLSQSFDIFFIFDGFKMKCLTMKLCKKQ